MHSHGRNFIHCIDSSTLFQVCKVHAGNVGIQTNQKAVL